MSESSNRDSGSKRGTKQAGEGNAKPVQGLSVEQEKALACLIKGEPIKTAAQAAGVNRGTVYRWIKADALFRSAFITWQQEQRESCRAALYKAAEAAVGRIVHVVDFDSKLALTLCRELGFFSGRDKAITDLEMVQKEIAAEQLEVEGALEWRQLNQQLRKAGLSLAQAKQLSRVLKDPSLLQEEALTEQNS